MFEKIPQCEHSKWDQFPPRTNHNNHASFFRVPRHTAGRRAVHLPRSVQVHVDRPVGGDADRLGGLHVRRRDAPSPREPSSLRHPGGWKLGFQSRLGRAEPAVVWLLRGSVGLFFWVPPCRFSRKFQSPLQ